VCPTTGQLVFANRRTRVFLDVPTGMNAKVALPRQWLGTSIDSGLLVGTGVVVRKFRQLGHWVCPKRSKGVLNDITPLQIKLLVLVIQTSNSAPSRGSWVPLEPGLRRCRRVRSYLC
jgi:hypothetical protein